MELLNYKHKKDWDKVIDNRGCEFKDYLKEIVGSYNYTLLDKLSKEVDVYIFSGIIKDFLLGYRIAARDIDITFRGKLKKRWEVIANHKFKIITNRFGGFKLLSEDSISVDIWNIENTYGIKNKIDSASPYDLLNIVFFNFTSVVYDFSKEKFIYDERFLDFLENRTIEIVNIENPDLELCFVNIYHNVKKYGIGLGRSVKNWALEFFREDLYFNHVQEKHFHTQLYSQIELLNFISDKLLK